MCGCTLCIRHNFTVVGEFIDTFLKWRDEICRFKFEINIFVEKGTARIKLPQARKRGSSSGLIEQNSNKSTNFFIQEYVPENIVCNMAAIWYRYKCAISEWYFLFYQILEHEVMRKVFDLAANQLLCGQRDIISSCIFSWIITYMHSSYKLSGIGFTTIFTRLNYLLVWRQSGNIGYNSSQYIMLQSNCMDYPSSMLMALIIRMGGLVKFG